MIQTSFFWGIFGHLPISTLPLGFPSPIEADDHMGDFDLPKQRPVGSNSETTRGWFFLLLPTRRKFDIRIQKNIYIYIHIYKKTMELTIFDIQVVKIKECVLFSPMISFVDHEKWHTNTIQNILTCLILYISSLWKSIQKNRKSMEITGHP